MNKSEIKFLGKSLCRRRKQQHGDGKAATKTYHATKHLKGGCLSLQQNALPIPHHLQNYVKKDLYPLIEHGHKIVSYLPVVYSNKRDNSVKLQTVFYILVHILYEKGKDWIQTFFKTKSANFNYMSNLKGFTHVIQLT